MPREYKTRDKKVRTMTHNEPDERNAATGEKQRFSKQELDFDLRNEQLPPHQERTGKKESIVHNFHQIQSSRQQKLSEQAVDLRQAVSNDTGDISLPWVHNTQEAVICKNQMQNIRWPTDNATLPQQSEADPDKPMEAAKSTERSFEAQIHEFPTELSLQRHGKDVLKNSITITAKPLPKEKHPGQLKFSYDTEQISHGAKPLQNSTKYQENLTQKINKPESPDKQPVSEDVKPDTKKPYKGKPPSRSTAKNPVKPRRLQFTKDEQAATDGAQSDKKLSKLKGKADKTSSKLEKARSELPSISHANIQHTFNETKGKAESRLQFEKKILPPGEQKTFTPMPAALLKKDTNGIKRIGRNVFLQTHGRLHQKIYEVEHENVGIKAGHRTEQVAESVYRGGRRITRSAFQYVRNRPYRTVAKFTKKAAKANIKYAYQSALNENPQLRSNVFSRYMQKRKIKQQYARAARDAKRTGQVIKKTGSITGNAAKAVAGMIRRHPIATGIIVLLLLLVFFMYSLFSSFASMASGSLSAIVASSYLASDNSIDSAELNYTEWETDLQTQINRTEQDYPGYDEYRYQADNIGHNPYELMAFLTAVYQDFEYADIQAILQQIFGEQYQLAFTDETEVRYRGVMRINPDTGEEYEDTEAYDWHILNISLTSHSFTDVITPYMDSGQCEIYALLMQTKGNRQYMKSPFEFNWLPYVTNHYGYRIHPITGVKDYHMGIDIGMPVGTQIQSGQDGRVTFAGYSGDYGYVVVIENDNGIVSKYAHCDLLLVSAGQEVKTGDVIAKFGSTGNSTEPHLHLEVIKDGQYLNPLYFAETNDTVLSVPAYGYPGTPMGDGSYAALIGEAEKYLGYPYVWGGSSPSTSFDCSGFVCWVLNQSGTANVGRTTAQGLYNLCTPVSPSDAQPGDLIFFHSTYSTVSTVTHVGIYVGNGMMLHAGNPIQYASIHTNYWQNHFFAFGRLS